MRSEAKLQRRVFLKALGVGLSVPVALQFSRMALAQPARPKRLILYYFPHGVPNEHMDFEPYLMPANPIFQDYGKDPQAGAVTRATHVVSDYVLNTRSNFNMLEPLAPYRNMMSIVRGLRQPGEFGTHDSIGTILTGDRMFSSLDQFVAKEMNARSLFLGAVTRINQQLDTTNGVLCRNEAGWRTPENDIVKAYDEIFGNLGTSPTPTEPVTNESTFRNQALDLTIGEVVEMRRTLSGLTQEESKLSAHLAALENLKAQGGGLGDPGGPDCDSAPIIPYLDEFRAARATYMSNDGTEYWQDGTLTWRESGQEQKTNFTKLAMAQAELAAHAVLCGHAQIATIQNGWASADYALPAILPHRANESYHNQISHQGYDGDLTKPTRIDFATVQQWFLARVARMCEILNRPDPFDPEHTALENTIIYAFSEIGDGDQHTKALTRMYIGAEATQIFGYYPAIIVGGGGGSLAPGRLLTVDNRPIPDLLLTLAQAMGSSTSTFGSLSTGPIRELLV